MPNYARQIAMAHTIFNVANTIVLYPWLGKFVGLMRNGSRPAKEEKGLQLDPRLLNNPVVALGQAGKETVRLAEMADKNFHEACQALLQLNEEDIKNCYEREDKIDGFEHRCRNSSQI